MADFNPTQIVAVLVTLLVIMVTVLVGVAIMDGITGVGGSGEPESRASSPLVSTGDAVSFADTSLFAGSVKRVDNVRDSTGHSLGLRGSPNSTYESDTTFTVADDSTWTVSSWQAWNQSYGTTNGTVYSLNGRLILQYNNSSQQWVGWYYNESSRFSHRVTVAATSQPGSLQNVQLWSNGTHFTIYRNNTRGTVADLRVESHDDPLLNASNWAGRQDELRGYDTALNASSRQALIDKPVQPLAGHSPRFRIMMDEGSGSTEPVYFADATLTLENTSYVNGLPGNNLNEGSDYTVNLEDGTITALVNGQLDGAPTVFVAYTYNPGGAASGLANDIAGAYEFFAIVPIVFVAMVLISAVSAVRE